MDRSSRSATGAGQDLDLAAVVHQEGAVEYLQHLAALQPVGRRPHRLDVLGVAAVDDQVLLQGRPSYVEAADGGDVPPASPMAVARRPSEPAVVGRGGRRRIE